MINRFFGKIDDIFLRLSVFTPEIVSIAIVFSLVVVLVETALISGGFIFPHTTTGFMEITGLAFALINILSCNIIGTSVVEDWKYCEDYGDQEDIVIRIQGFLVLTVVLLVISFACFSKMFYEYAVFLISLLN